MPDLSGRICPELWTRRSASAEPYFKCNCRKNGRPKSNKSQWRYFQLEEMEMLGGKKKLVRGIWQVGLILRQQILRPRDAV